MQSKENASSAKMPAGTPWSGKQECPPKKKNKEGLPVSDPPVPNRAHTEMRSEYPQEVPPVKQNKEV